MAEDQRPKQTAFRLPQRTLDILDGMVNSGKARTRTDALILVVDAANKPISTDDSFVVDKIKEYESRISRLEDEKEVRNFALELAAQIPDLWEFLGKITARDAQRKKSEKENDNLIVDRREEDIEDTKEMKKIIDNYYKKIKEDENK